MSIGSSNPPCGCLSSHPPTTTLIAEDDNAREILVQLRRPFAVADQTDPRQSLIDRVQDLFRRSQYAVDNQQLVSAIDEVLGRGLVQYNQDRKCFYLTQKAAEVFDRLFIVTCSHCGAANVKPTHDADEIKELTFCCRCQHVI
ncbi:MAG: hypothetical protein ACOYUZ_04610 [Patescibacteria group bacterium]